jgi:hypothetical protein
MPDLDVSDVLLDPDFAEQLAIQRRTQTMVKGRPSMTTATISPAPWGAVIPQNDVPMQRGPNQQHLPRLLQVHTQFRLRGASKDPDTGADLPPDLIVWNGDTFIVNKVQDFSRFGAGFIQADCSSTDPTDNEPA